MEKVVYLLGAGFTAPLGLPVMSNFLVKSKDLFFERQEELSHFQEVFDTVSDLSVVKNYFRADLFNIEEILSILEMGSQLEGLGLSDQFKRYISDVIESFTPPLQARSDWPGNWQDFIFGNNNTWRSYGFFVANLYGLQFRMLETQESERVPHFDHGAEIDTEYSVITLNYDRVIEAVPEYLTKNLQHKHPPSIIDQPVREAHLNETENALPLAKLHGSIDGEIVPPTWSKTVSDPILAAWKLAFELISRANHLRVIGYSLPTADAYVKYLLKSGVRAAQHLKRIDIICMDRDGSVQARYDDFIDFNYYRFANEDVIKYLEDIESLSNPGGFQRKNIVVCDHLEQAHRQFMEKRSA